MASVKNCPICNIGGRILLQNDKAVAFLSDPRKVTGHLIISPKRHIEKPWEMTESELVDVFGLINILEQKLIGKIGDGFDVRQNYRPFLEESRLKLDHILYHLIPRRKFDHIYEISERFDTVLFTALPDQETEIINTMLK